MVSRGKCVLSRGARSEGHKFYARVEIGVDWGKIKERKKCEKPKVLREEY